MKIGKIFNQLFRPMQRNAKNTTQTILPPPIEKYNPKDITLEEFRAYVHYLASNKINRTFVEPTEFITEAERAKRKAFRERIRYLAENNIDQIFYC